MTDEHLDRALFAGGLAPNGARVAKMGNQALWDLYRKCAILSVAGQFNAAAGRTDWRNAAGGVERALYGRLAGRGITWADHDVLDSLWYILHADNPDDWSMAFDMAWLAIPPNRQLRKEGLA